MTEANYIDATNLAKLRTALNIINDFLPMTPDQEVADKSIKNKLYGMIKELENSVNKAIESDQK